MRINTQDFDYSQMKRPLDRMQVYNALDCCVTHEVFLKFKESFLKEEAAKLIYEFERALQAPALQMMRRGILIDVVNRSETIDMLRKQLDLLHTGLNRMAHEVWGKPLNPNSPAQLKEFFYKRLRAPEKYTGTKSDRRLTTDREALEKLDDHIYSRPFARVILACRELSKKLSVLTTAIDPDGRMRTSYKITGTETGRWSSSTNVFNRGTNLQNITPILRNIFVADKGKKMAYIDLEQAESRIVGMLVYLQTHDSSYLDACESGDLHTAVCRMVWPHLDWTGDLHHDRTVVAAQKFYRHFSYRDMAKRGGHGTNYYGTPWTMARHLKVETKVMEMFQVKYFEAFPGIPEWHRKVAEELQTTGEITTPLGRRRQFTGRLREDSTLREAIAYVPQSTVGDLLNFGLLRLWRKMEPEIELLAQVHDAVLIQYAEEKESELLPQAQAWLEIPIPLAERQVLIPTEVEVGWNWAKRSSKNPDGLIEWTGNDNRSRQNQPEVSMLRCRI